MCINNFASVVKSYTKEIEPELFKPFVKQILEDYAGYFSNSKASWDINAKKEDVEVAMLQIQKVANGWGIGNKYWSDHKRVFNVSK